MLVSRECAQKRSCSLSMPTKGGWITVAFVSQVVLFLGIFLRQLYWILSFLTNKSSYLWIYIWECMSLCDSATVCTCCKPSPSPLITWKGFAQITTRWQSCILVTWSFHHKLPGRLLRSFSPSFAPSSVFQTCEYF